MNETEFDYLSHNVAMLGYHTKMAEHYKRLVEDDRRYAPFVNGEESAAPAVPQPYNYSSSRACAHRRWANNGYGQRCIACGMMQLELKCDVQLPIEIIVTILTMTSHASYLTLSKEIKLKFISSLYPLIVSKPVSRVDTHRVSPLTYVVFVNKYLCAWVQIEGHLTTYKNAQTVHISQNRVIPTTLPSYNTNSPKFLTVGTYIKIIENRATSLGITDPLPYIKEFLPQLRNGLTDWQYALWIYCSDSANRKTDPSTNEVLTIDNVLNNNSFKEYGL